MEHGRFLTFMLWKIIIGFQAVSNDTKFNGVNGYEDFVNEFGVTESDEGEYMFNGKSGTC